MDLVLGIDPGIARCGYGIVYREHNAFVCVEYGCIETPAKTEDGDRLKMLHDELGRLIKKHKPVRAGVEKLYFSKNVTTGLQVSQARGVILLALAEAGIDLVELTPNEVKQAVSGFGAADKKQMQKMVQMTLKLKEIPKPDDAADALAVAITAACWREELKK